MSHKTDPATMVCSCGRSRMQHLNIELMNAKWKMLNFQKKVDVPMMLKEINEALKI